MRAVASLTDDERRTIYEGDLCRGLASSNGYKWLLQEANRILQTYENAACTGMASWDDYKHCVGIMDGIRTVLGIVPAAIEASEQIVGAAADES